MHMHISFRDIQPWDVVFSQRYANQIIRLSTDLIERRHAGQLNLAAWKCGILK